MLSPYNHIQYTPKVAACHEVLVMFFVHFSMTLTLSRGLRPMTFALYRPANHKAPATDGLARTSISHAFGTGSSAPALWILWIDLQGASPGLSLVKYRLAPFETRQKFLCLPLYRFQPFRG